MLGNNLPSVWLGKQLVLVALGVSYLRFTPTFKISSVLLFPFEVFVVTSHVLRPSAIGVDAATVLLAFYILCIYNFFIYKLNVFVFYLRSFLYQLMFHLSSAGLMLYLPLIGLQKDRWSK
jgi:hypothetical protein